MSEFINTIDALGDDAVVDSIIQRTITEFKDDQITEIGDYAFFGCDKLENVELLNATQIKDNAFGGCAALKTVKLPNVVEIGSSAFYDKSDSKNQIETLFLPAATHIGNSAFADCAMLKKVILPLLESLDSYVFAWCRSIEYADFGSLKSASGYQAMVHSAASLKSLVIRTDSLCVLTATNVFIIGSNAYIYVPAALIEDYKIATNWSNYADQFRALEDYTIDGTTTGELDETKI